MSNEYALRSGLFAKRKLPTSTDEYWSCGNGAEKQERSKVKVKGMAIRDDPHFHPLPLTSNQPGICRGRLNAPAWPQTLLLPA
jgi:hypothetical protein